MKMKIIFSIAFVTGIAFSGVANSQNNLLEKFKNIQGAIENKAAAAEQENKGLAGPAINPPKASPTSNSFDQYAIDADELCVRIKDPKFRQYAAGVDKLMRVGHSAVGNPDIKFIYDTKDGLVSKWITSVLDDLRKKASGSGDINRLTRLKISWTDAANKCASTLWETSAAFLFTSSDRAYYELRDKIDKKDSSKQTTPRTLSLNGKIEESQRASGIFIWKYLMQNNDTYNIPRPDAIPMLLAILDKDGKISDQVHNEVMDSLNSETSKWVEYKNKSDAQTAEKLQKEKLNEAKKVAMQKQQDEMFRKIKSGDLKAAQSCYDIISAIEIDDSLEAALTPHKRLKSGAGRIGKYVEKNGAGNMLIIRSGYPAEIRTSSNTIWFDRDSIRIGSDVVVVGKYVDNTIIRLTDGNGRQSPVLDAVCIQPE